MRSQAQQPVQREQRRRGPLLNGGNGEEYEFDNSPEQPEETPARSCEGAGDGSSPCLLALFDAWHFNDLVDI
jgi:hypothetical protein